MSWAFDLMRLPQTHTHTTYHLLFHALFDFAYAFTQHHIALWRRRHRTWLTRFACWCCSTFEQITFLRRCCNNTKKFITITMVALLLLLLLLNADNSHLTLVFVRVPPTKLSNPNCGKVGSRWSLKYSIAIVDKSMSSSVILYGRPKCGLMRNILITLYTSSKIWFKKPKFEAINDNRNAKRNRCLSQCNTYGTRKEATMLVLNVSTKCHLQQLQTHTTCLNDIAFTWQWVRSTCRFSVNENQKRKKKNIKLKCSFILSVDSIQKMVLHHLDSSNASILNRCAHSMDGINVKILKKFDCSSCGRTISANRSGVVHVDLKKSMQNETTKKKWKKTKMMEKQANTALTFLASLF